jgi:hypothetical protein
MANDVPEAGVFTAHGQPLTCFGVYKIVRRHTAGLDDPAPARRPARTPPPSTFSRPTSKST